MQMGPRRSTYKRTTEEHRQLILDEEAGGEPIRLAQHLEICKSTAYNILKRQRAQTRPRDGKRLSCTKVTEDIKQKLLRFLEDHNDATLRELANSVNNVISTETVAKVLDGEAKTTKII